jgi:methionyl-tRNA synthetase
LGKVVVASAWPYVNHVPHLGTFLHLLSADVAARYYRMKGEDVVMVSGSDEHGTPVEVEALRLGIPPKELADKNHGIVADQCKKWKFTFDNYTRTENPIHKEFVQNLLREIYKNGYIFSKETEMLYCEQCERFLPDRFVTGKCPYCAYERARGDQCETCGRLLEPEILIDPYCVICGSKPAMKQTTHWYFDLSKLSEKIGDFVEKNDRLPNNARNFTLNLIRDGLQPRAMTRDIAWGIPAPFPGAEGKSVYVWFDAVLGYVSATIEYFRDKQNPENWRDFWFDKNTKTLYFIGKDNIPFHTVILPALLLASGEGYNLPWNVSTTEFIQFRGEKASKSQKIGIWINEALELFPADYWRFFMMATRPETKDSNFSWELFIEKINADLNDTFGNFVHRTLTFVHTRFKGEVPESTDLAEDGQRVLAEVDRRVTTLGEEIEGCQLQTAANSIIAVARIGNQYLNEKEPWNLMKTDPVQAANVFYVSSQIVKKLSVASAPFIPSAAEKMWKTMNLPGSVHEPDKWEEAFKLLPPRQKIMKPEPLFNKIDADEKELDERLEKVRAHLSTGE